MRYAIITPGGVISNIMEWDGTSPWEPPDKCQAFLAPRGETGWQWNGGDPIDPRPSPPLPLPPVDQADSNNLSKQLKAILISVGLASGKTPAQMRSLFLTAYNSLP